MNARGSFYDLVLSYPFLPIVPGLITHLSLSWHWPMIINHPLVRPGSLAQSVVTITEWRNHQQVQRCLQLSVCVWNHSIPCIFHILDIFLMIPTKCTLIYLTPIPRSSYMFRCVSHHHQGELTFSLHKTICFFIQLLSICDTVVAS
jgi:hypothetical protein